jgi:protein SCO1
MNRRRCMAGLLVSATYSHGAAQAEPSWLKPGPRVPDVVLQDHTGASHALGSLCRRPVGISFFYTGCASICPPQTAAMRALRARLDAAAVQADDRSPLLLSISLDPLGDSPDALRAYATRFGARLGLDAGWLMLTGAPRSLERVWRSFDAPVGQPADHTALLWVGDATAGKWTRASALSPTARLVDLFTRGLA